MMLKYYLLALILIYAVMEVGWVLDLLSVSMLFLSLIFYTFTFYLIAGLKSTTILTEGPFAEVATTRLIYVTALALLFFAGTPLHMYSVFFMMPWIAVGIGCDALIALVKLNLIEYEENDEEL